MIGRTSACAPGGRAGPPAEADVLAGLPEAPGRAFHRATGRTRPRAPPQASGMSMLVRDWLLDPLGLIVLWTFLLVIAVAASGRRRGARALFPFALWYLGIAAVAAPAIVNPLVASLEDEVPAGACAPGTPVVVLGGGIDGAAADADRFEAMSRKTLARVVEAGRLAASEPGVRIIVAGGARGAAVPEADIMSRWLERTGVPHADILPERRSTSTAGNAREVAAMLRGTGPDARAIRLVTSALHMPRALGAFRAAGLDACPVPVDRISYPDVPGWALWPQTTALAKFDEWLHEVLALALYRRRGDFAAEAAGTAPDGRAGRPVGLRRRSTRGTSRRSAPRRPRR